MTLEETVSWMKKEKILALKLPDGTAISLDPEAFALPPPEPEADGGLDLDEVGSTGMTRREQLELLGRTFDADFKKAKR